MAAGLVFLLTTFDRKLRADWIETSLPDAGTQAVP